MPNRPNIPLDDAGSLLLLNDYILYETGENKEGRKEMFYIPSSLSETGQMGVVHRATASRLSISRADSSARYEPQQHHDYRYPAPINQGDTNHNSTTIIDISRRFIRAIRTTTASRLSISRAD